MYRNEEWLREQLVVNRRLYKDIADDCGVSKSTIMAWSRKYSISSPNKGINLFSQTSNPNRKVDDNRLRDEIYERYSLNGEKVSDIAVDLGISPNPIYRVIRKYNLPRFNYSTEYRRSVVEKTVLKLKEIEKTHGFVNYKLASDYGIYENTKNYFDGSFRDACLKLGLKYVCENSNEFLSLGTQFENMVGNLLDYLNISNSRQKVIKVNGSVLRPDFILDQNDWADAKLSNSAITDNSISKYSSKCRNLYFIFGVDTVDEIKNLPENVYTINVETLIYFVKSPTKRAFFNGEIAQIRQLYYSKLSGTTEGGC
jgi:transposase